MRPFLEFVVTTFWLGLRLLATSLFILLSAWTLVWIAHGLRWPAW